MAAMHSDFKRYVKLMRSRRYLQYYDEGKGWTDKCKNVYFYVRVVLLTGTFVINVFGLYNNKEKMGMLDGSLIFLPLSIQSSVMASISVLNHGEHVKLINSMDGYFVEHNEPWMVEIREKITVQAYKVLKLVLLWDLVTACNYSMGPILADTVLHYGLDWLKSPLYLPGYFSPLLGDDVTWNGTYYTLLVAHLWGLWELVGVQHGYVTGYVRMSVSYLTELTIFKEKVKSFNIDESPENVDRQFRHILSSHREVMSLNKDLKAFLGLPCAFQTLFTSLTLTLTLFTAFTSTNIPVVIAYGSGFMFYFSAGLLYCSLGQLLENESEEVFRALCNLPWYRYSPAVRKDFIMMMRQARSPLIIDYHGRSKMNLDNFMQILRESYSYFTLLQSVTGK